LAWRTRQILTVDRPEIQGYDQDAWARTLRYAAMPLDVSLGQLRGVRAANLRLWRSLTPAELARVGLHSERGPESLDLLIRMMGAHDLSTGGRSIECWRRPERRGGEGGLDRVAPRGCHADPLMFEFHLDATQGAARAGTLTLPHGIVETPAFMPVGTHGVVRGLSPSDVARTGAQIVLGNSYHLHLRPGEAVVERMGGLNRFTTWPKPMLTDSGGFQVFSLEGLRRIGEDGVEFQSHVDGSFRTLTPERAMEIQIALGADVAMAFDHVVPGQAPRALALEGMERTLRWLDRCKARHEQAVGRSGGQPAAASDDSAGNRPPDRLTARPPDHQTLCPSCRAAPTTTSACARSRARSRADRGPVSPSAGSRWASPSR